LDRKRTDHESVPVDASCYPDLPRDRRRLPRDRGVGLRAQGLSQQGAQKGLSKGALELAQSAQPAAMRVPRKGARPSVWWAKERQLAVMLGAKARRVHRVG
jgi:hypothetical protein